MIRIAELPGNLSRAVYCATRPAANPRPPWMAGVPQMQEQFAAPTPLYCAHAARRVAQAAVRGAADIFGLELEPRSAAHRRGGSRHGLGRGRDLEPLAPFIGASL